MQSNPWIRPDRPLAIAHRGHSIALPENTMVAYARAIELGAEMIEADLQLSRDGWLVMMHDATLDRTTSGSGSVRAASFAEIRALDAGRWFGPAFAGTQVPAAEELIELAREGGIGLCLEVKASDAEEARRVGQATAELIVAHRALGWCFMASYYHEALAAARAVAPVLLAPERLPDHLPADPPEALRQARALGAPVLQHEHRVTTPELVKTLHEAEIAVWLWTVNTPDELRRAFALGVDGLMGDDVAAITAAIAEGQRGSERVPTMSPM